MKNTTKHRAPDVNWLPLTDGIGVPLVDREDLLAEPNPGSIVMSGGEWGVAWQHHFKDRRWHSTSGASLTWKQLIRHRNLVLIYDAYERGV